MQLEEPLTVSHPLGFTTIPAGFRCDLESVPAFCHWLPGFGKLGKGAVPGIIHDWLYRTGLVSRPVADAVYLEAMKQRNVSGPVRWIKYLAVRAFGWIAWRKHRIP